MKCITLWEPWASAIAVGLKKIETRGWATSHRGPIAFHAAKRKVDAEFLDELVLFPEIVQAFANAGIDLYGDEEVQFPRGCIVAVAELVDCIPTEQLKPNPRFEQLFGNYDDGRFGWILENVHRVYEPVPFLGRQGFYDLPTDVALQVDARTIRP